MSKTAYPSLKPFYSRPWAEWIDEVDKNKLKISAVEQRTTEEKASGSAAVTLLPRKDIMLYGTCPKNDLRVLCRCERCNKLLMPVAYVQHMKDRHGPDQYAHPSAVPAVPSGASLLKKKYSHSKNKKKINPPPVPPPPLFQTYEAPVPASPIQAPAAISAGGAAAASVAAAVAATGVCGGGCGAGANAGVGGAAGGGGGGAGAGEGRPAAQPLRAAKSELEVLAEAAPGGASAAAAAARGPGSPKHRRSKKSSKRGRDYDPDRHCGVPEAKGPCLRSLTCSTHMLHLRKAVPGRSKDLQQLIAELEASKDKEAITAALVSLIPKCSSLTNTLTIAAAASTTTATQKSSDIRVITQPLHISVPGTGVSIVSTQGNNESSTSVVYMPMSPVAVMSPVQLGGTAFRAAPAAPAASPPLATQPVVVTLPAAPPSHGPLAAPQYPVHPKPLVMAAGPARKIGGSFVLHGQRVDKQRGEIQTASNARRALNCARHHKPNILRSGGGGAGAGGAARPRQANAKRASGERLASADAKHARLADPVAAAVNGFVLHADVAEAAAAEAPHANSVTFLNMK